MSIETLETLGVRVQVDADARVLLTECDGVSTLAKLPDSPSRNGREWYTGRYFGTRDAARAAIAAGNPPKALVKLYDEERARLSQMLADPERVAVSVKRRRVYGDVGDELSVERLAVGEPEHWASLTRGAKRKRLVIGLQSGHTCDVCGMTNCEYRCPAAPFARVAAIGAALADVYTAQGYAVDVCSVYPHNGHGVMGRFADYRCFNVVSMKAADQRLDPLALLCVGIPAYARLLEHSVWDAVFDAPLQWWAEIPTLDPETVEALGIDLYLTGEGVHIPHPENHRGLAEALKTAQWEG